VTERTIGQRLFTLTLFLLLGCVTQSAYSYPPPENLTCNLGIQVNRCHPRVETQTQPPRCQLEACHHNLPPERDIEETEYRTQHSNSTALIHESRSLTPTLKIGTAFTIQLMTSVQFTTPATASRTPRQAQRHLRTIVLRH